MERCDKCRCELRIVRVEQKPDRLVYRYACKNRRCPSCGAVAREIERPVKNKE